MNIVGLLPLTILIQLFDLLIKTKQSARDKDVMDRVVLEREITALNDNK